MPSLTFNRTLFVAPLFVAAAAMFLLVSASPLAAQKGIGLYVPVTETEDDLPPNLPKENMYYQWKLVTDMEPTAENFKRLAEQQFSLGTSWSNGNGQRVGNFKLHPGDNGNLPAEPALTSAGLEIGLDWDLSQKVGTSAQVVNYLRSNPPPTYLQTQDLSFTVRRPANDQVEFITSEVGPGRRFELHPAMQTILKSLNKQFEVALKGNSEEITVPSPDGGKPNKMTIQHPSTLRLTLTDAQATQYLAAMSQLPAEMGAELRKPKVFIVISIIQPTDGAYGPVLRIDTLRIVSSPLAGKKSMKIGIRKLGVLYCRVRPTLENFAELLKTEVDDPQFTDRFRRCPPVTTVLSQFTMPTGCEIPQDTFGGTKPMFKTKEGISVPHIQPLFALYEDSFKANDPIKPFIGIHEKPLFKKQGQSLVIGHYYYVVDERSVDEESGKTTYKETIKVSRSSYVNLMHSNETTMGFEVEAKAEFLGIGGGTKFSFEEKKTNSQELGNSLTRDVEIAIEAEIAHKPGALIIRRFPVIISGGRVLGTDTFTFDREEERTMGPAQETVYFRHDGEDGLLKRVRSKVNPKNTKEITFYLGEEIGGDFLNVVRQLGFDDGMKDNYLAGRWRETDLRNGAIAYQSIDSKGMVTEHGDAKPWCQITVGTMQARRDSTGQTYGAASAELFDLEDKTKEELQLELREGPMGKRSKIVFRDKDGKPVGFMIRVGGDEPTQTPW